MEHTELLEIEGLKLFYRPNTTDENCLKEVLSQKVYNHNKHGFHVESGENWIDLGANIGAFAAYCKLMKVENYTGFEPIEINFQILTKNFEYLGLQGNIFNAAVTNVKKKKITMYAGSKDSDRYRMTTVENKRKIGKMNNIYGGVFDDISCDGVKMDIEGSEFGLIEDELLPKCEKLVFEYHFSKDRSMKNFHKRMGILKDTFHEVKYMPSLDKFDVNGKFPGFYDRMIYCLKRK